jgi:hypothetical protein
MIRVVPLDFLLMFMLSSSLPDKSGLPPPAFFLLSCSNAVGWLADADGDTG